MFVNIKRILFFILLTFPLAVNAQTQTVSASWVRASVAFGSITSSYVILVTNTPSGNVLAKQYRLCRFKNNTDAAISVSMDGTNDDLPYISAGTAEYMDLAADGRTIGTSIYVKYPGAAPSSGSFYINCIV
jgi:hypothetical protein